MSPLDTYSLPPKSVRFSQSLSDRESGDVRVFKCPESLDLHAVP